MSDLNLEPEEDQPRQAPTLEAERRFLGQCEHGNRSLTALGKPVRALLRQRGWRWRRL